MDLVLFGMQGSGKGTQSKLLAERCSFTIFETGAELRRLAAEDSDLGLKVKAIIEAGNLVPTEVVMEIIADFLHHLPEGQAALFDGIPRSEDQRKQFDTLMEIEGRRFMGLHIELSEAEALKRLSTRRICPSCKTIYPAAFSSETCEKDASTLLTRQDDTPNAIRTRLDNYREKTLPVLEYYKAAEKMLTVDGEQSIEAVAQAILNLVAPYFPCQK